MKPSPNFLGALILAFGVGNTVAVAPQGTGNVSPATPSYSKGPDSGRKTIYVTAAKVGSHNSSSSYL